VITGKSLTAHTAPWLQKLRGGELGEKRSEILRAAIAARGKKAGTFTFTAPTGSGKTISSMSFALAHARRRNGLRRVIYVIPYCSIIEQTQAVFEDVFGRGSIVAHYADVEYKTDENRPDGERDKRYLAAENWDAPVVLTTTVQFFESLFGNRPSRCRKLHNLAGSVLILTRRRCSRAVSAPLRRGDLGACEKLRLLRRALHGDAARAGKALCRKRKPARNGRRRAVPAAGGAIYGAVSPCALRGHWKAD
jgi:hypothetical protein